VKHPQVNGVTHEYASCEGVKIHIARAGIDPAKQLILFLHGFPECAYFPFPPGPLTHEGCARTSLPIGIGMRKQVISTDSLEIRTLLTRCFSRRFWYSWRAQLEGLSGDFEVAALDLPGYNASEQLKSTSAYVTGNLCTIIKGALTYLKRESCVLVGACPSNSSRNDVPPAAKVHRPTR
jgi:pimeloyl-ACP methyl ester carboxylesterase